MIMKKIVNRLFMVILVKLLLPVTIFAQQVPDMMSYQAVIRDASGNLVSNRQVKIRISILQGATDGNSVFIEEHLVTTNENGLVSLVIGSGHPGYAGADLKSSAPDDDAVAVYGEFSAIRWNEGPYFIKVETDLNGGSDYTIAGISQLLSVPYAKYAGKAGNTKFRDGADTNDAVYTKGNVGIGTEEPDAPLSVKTDSVPAITISSLTKNNPDRPGIMFKNNTSHFISGDGLSDEYFGFYSKWSSERYYDAKLRVFGKAKKSWGTYLEMTHDGTNATIRTDVGDIKIAPAGNIDAGGKRITNVGSPVNGSDVVTKEYLENFLAQLKIPSIVVKDID